MFSSIYEDQMGEQYSKIGLISAKQFATCWNVTERKGT